MKQKRLTGWEERKSIVSIWFQVILFSFGFIFHFRYAMFCIWKTKLKLVTIWVKRSISIAANRTCNAHMDSQRDSHMHLKPEKTYENSFVCDFDRGFLMMKKTWNRIEKKQNKQRLKFNHVSENRPRRLSWQATISCGIHSIAIQDRTDQLIDRRGRLQKLSAVYLRTARSTSGRKVTEKKQWTERP